MWIFAGKGLCIYAIHFLKYIDKSTDLLLTAGHCRHLTIVSPTVIYGMCSRNFQCHAWFLSLHWGWIPTEKNTVFSLNRWWLWWFGSCWALGSLQEITQQIYDKSKSLTLHILGMEEVSFSKEKPISILCCLPAFIKLWAREYWNTVKYLE